jgi:hypothetical protein
MSLVVENEREWNGTHKEKFGMKEIQNLSFKILCFAKKKKKKMSPFCVLFCRSLHATEEFGEASPCLTCIKL